MAVFKHLDQTMCQRNITYSEVFHLIVEQLIQNKRSNYSTSTDQKQEVKPELYTTDYRYNVIKYVCFLVHHEEGSELRY